MYKNLPKQEKWILKGIPLIFILGSSMHFWYILSRNNILVAFIAPVNESIWEHSKMLLFPVILWWVIYYLFKGLKYNIDKNKWFTGALVSLTSSLITMPMFYYFYTGAFGVELLLIDIIILLVSIILGQLLGYHFYKYSKGFNSIIPICLFIIIITLFMIFTIFPPTLPIFKDGPSGQYGILFT